MAIRRCYPGDDVSPPEGWASSCERPGAKENVSGFEDRAGAVQKTPSARCSLASVISLPGVAGETPAFIFPYSE